MRLVNRFLTVALISILIPVSGFSIDLNGGTAVIVDYPGGTASLAGAALGQPLHEEAKYTFLLDLLRYLDSKIDKPGEKFEVEITGPLPSSAHEERIDFYLIEGSSNTRRVLYRYGASAIYKRAAINVKRMEIPREIVLTAEGISATDTAPVYRISRGQTVKVILISGVVRLEVEGEALETAASVDPVKVKVRGTGREFVGSIAGPMEVHVVL